MMPYINDSTGKANTNEPTRNTSEWTVQDSAQLYGTSHWGAGYFDVSDNGDAVVTVDFNGSGKQVSVPIIDIVKGMQERGLEMPAVLRIENLLDHRIKQLNEAFARAIKECGYRNHYRGVFPIKVNQQCHVIEEIATFGGSFHHGLEAGSKAELIIALSQLKDHDSFIVCNGYKDAEFIELGLYAKQMGIRTFFVVETPAELPIIIKQSQALGIEPLIGVRIRLSVAVEGHWEQDSGDRSIFGLSTAALLDIVEQLKAANMLHCLQLLHCHIGSQIPNIRNIRSGVLEACRYYSGLVAEGAPMGFLDMGGGLAVDYEGSCSNSTHSMNYQLDEYCVDIVETIRENLDPLNIEHPVIITESGRATVAYSSMLLFNILDVRDHKPTNLPESLPENSHEQLQNLWYVKDNVQVKKLQESYNDCLYYRDEVRELFRRGQINLRERALAENIALAIFEEIALLLPQVERFPSELENLPTLLSDIYYGNFSLFQSLPDIWAIDQTFPIMPIHRLDEEPTREAILADITCDCDGKIDQFTTPDGVRSTLPLHPLRANEEYYLGVFLVGAYQETLGDLHNLFGDTNVVSVRVNLDGSYSFVREFHGDSIADVLSYVEYDPKSMQEQLRRNAEAAVREGKITVTMRQQILKAFRESLQGYTYFER
ncbi:biosynthetic arginine decarboxylase [Spartinivicinus poritis]|uniref:Arginine decarboxylase n=1 Tax=Spartinivicinus poritis TaxID=2994640 RepID=A0ABT5UBZ5_9GAMM|nr:biosynthetic arginine decarboxylase [Spartinivicinus sp. A2-2]MDE1463900.1 biosynthetic arginine decarboxylase [Spartinivicinus sp. A2-2]